MRAVIVLIFSLVGIPISFFRPHLGILFFSIHAYLRPNDLAWGIISLRYSLYIAVATLIGYILFEVRKRPVRLRPNLPLLLLWVYVMFSALFAFNRELASAKLEEFSKIVLISILTTALFDSEKRIKWLIWTIAISFGFLGLWGALRTIMTGGARLYGPGEASHITDNNDFALALDMSLPLLFYLGVHAGRKSHRVAFRIMAFCVFISVLFTYSRAGFIGLCIVALALALKASRRLVALLALASSTIIFVSLAPQPVLDRLSTIGKKDEPSFQGRLRSWRIATEVIRDHPVWGVGPRNFTLVRQLLYGKRPESQLVVHNGYLQLAAESGIPALMLFLSLLLSTFRKLRAVRRLAPLSSPSPHSMLLNYSHMIEIGVLSYMVINLSSSRQDLDLFYHFTALATCLLSLARQLTKAPATAEQAHAASSGGWRHASLPAGR